ncbi:MAG TPA: hypothetical protein ENH91_04345 [Leeuwenhoekiella sp.]|nr:hypothetical protein [Leeuwenhoekiella sp.]
MKNFIAGAILFFTVLACSSEDVEPTNDANIHFTGTVQNSISCMDDHKERIYEIILKDHPTITIFGAPNLPKEYRQTGLKITFDLGPESKNISICIDIYSPDYFHDVSNVRLVNKR